MIVRQHKRRAKGVDKYSKNCNPLNSRTKFCTAPTKSKKTPVSLFIQAFYFRTLLLSASFNTGTALSGSLHTATHLRNRSSCLGTCLLLFYPFSIAFCNCEDYSFVCFCQILSPSFFYYFSIVTSCPFLFFSQSPLFCLPFLLILVIDISPIKNIVIAMLT